MRGTARISRAGDPEEPLKRLACALVGVLIGSVGCGSDSGGNSDAAAIGDGPAITDAPAIADAPISGDAATTDAAAPDAGIGDVGIVTDTTAIADSAAAVCSSMVDAGAQCNALVNGASPVALVVVATPIPTGMGGTIYDGRYYLTEFKGYAGTPLVAGVTLRQTLEMCGNVGQLIGEETSGIYHKNYAVAPMGIQPNVTTTCSTQMPNVDIPYSSYTATPTSVTFYSSQYVFSGTYTKQP
jgi:hypothetical protein